MVLQVVNKSYKLNISHLTKTKTEKLVDLEIRYWTILNIIKTGVEYWDTVPGSDGLPFTKFNLHKLLYKGVSKDSDLQSQLIIDAIADAWENRKDPSARLNHPTIPFNRPRSGNLGKTKKGNPVVTIAIDDSGRARMALPIAKDGAWERLRSELNDSWDFTCFELQHLRTKQEDRWCIIINLRKEFEVSDLANSKTVLGIDTGSGTPAAITIVDKKGRTVHQQYFGRDIAHRQRQVWWKRGKLQSYASKGSRKAKNKLKKLKGYETNMVKSGCYQVAHRIVDLAAEHSSVLALEDLKGLNRPRKRKRQRKDGKGMEPLPRKVEKKINKKVHHIPYDILHTAIRSVGYQRQVGDVKVNPMYTSQTCFHCLVIDGSYRKGRIFVCGKCGLTVNADRNASGVIALTPLQERPQARHLGPVSRRDGRVNGHVWDHDGGKETDRGSAQTPEPKPVNSFTVG
jgi:hypothetical protein